MDDGHPTLIKFPPRGQILKANQLARQCAIDEHGLAIEVGNTPTIMGK